KKLLEKMGLDVEELNSGCCGMAGGWGYEPDHYEVSIACGERVLLPKVREAAAETLVVADGFSCRSQIEQTQTGREARHVAQVLEPAREHGAVPLYPERALAEAPPPSGHGRAVAVLLAAGAAAAATALAYRSR